MVNVILGETRFLFLGTMCNIMFTFTLWQTVPAVLWCLLVCTSWARTLGAKSSCHKQGDLSVSQWDLGLGRNKNR